MNGLTLHGVVGRRIFETWKVTKALLEQRDNGIQQAVFDVILGGAQDTLIDIRDFEKASFEEKIRRNPKVILRFAGA